MLDRLGRVIESETRLLTIKAVRNRQCRLCPLHRGAQSVCTMGNGLAVSPLMLVGEAPGQREDDLEKPFQGRAGALLDEVLDDVGLNRENVYVDNVVRCRPPDNRKPTEDEIKACRPYLVEVLKIVQPRVVVAMGATALYGMTGKTGISKRRGRPIWSSFGVLVVPTWHPAYVLRNMSQKSTLRDDLLLAKKRLGLYDHTETKGGMINACNPEGSGVSERGSDANQRPA